MELTSKVLNRVMEAYSKVSTKSLHFTRTSGLEDWKGGVGRRKFCGGGGKANTGNKEFEKTFE